MHTAFKKLTNLNAAKYAAQYRNPQHTPTVEESVALARAAMHAASVFDGHAAAVDPLMMARLRMAQVEEAARRPDALLAAALTADACSYAYRALAAVQPKLAKQAQRDLAALAYATAYPSAS